MGALSNKDHKKCNKNNQPMKHNKPASLMKTMKSDVMIRIHGKTKDENNHEKLENNKKNFFNMVL